MLIEASQLLNRRNTDIDDLVMNVIGTLVGYMIWWIFHKIFLKKSSIESSLKWEAVTLLGTAALGQFFLYNWRLIVKIFYA